MISETLSKFHAYARVGITLGGGGGGEGWMGRTPGFNQRLMVAAAFLIHPPPKWAAAMGGWVDGWMVNTRVAYIPFG